MESKRKVLFWLERRYRDLNEASLDLVKEAIQGTKYELRREMLAVEEARQKASQAESEALHAAIEFIRANYPEVLRAQHKEDPEEETPAGSD